MYVPKKKMTDAIFECCWSMYVYVWMYVCMYDTFASWDDKVHVATVADGCDGRFVSAENMQAVHECITGCIIAHTTTTVATTAIYA